MRITLVSVTAVSAMMTTVSVTTATVTTATVTTSKHSPEIHVTPVNDRYSLTSRKNFSIGIVPKLAVLAHTAIFARVKPQARY
jgi:hypothetical protein